MAPQSAFEIVLAAAALLLLARDLYHAWRDSQRRPVTLLAAAAIAVLLLGTLGERSGPHPWWLALPAAVLAWEAIRGWRVTPRSRLREAGMAAFAAALLVGAGGLALDKGPVAAVLVAAGAVAAAIGFALLWESRRREPKPWRPDDVAHYERRLRERSREERGS